MKVGDKFKLTEHDRTDQNKDYLVIRARHRLKAAGEKSDDKKLRSYFDPLGLDPDKDYPDSYRCDFETQILSDPFRNHQDTPKPRIAGIQTAVVTGPSGDEIYTDEYGRIKVQFHWDREGTKNEQTTCWIRCMQNIAGPQWGMIYIPRVGQEVVVQFEEGDPDRPLVTGVVYNADNMPPYTLPTNKTMTGVKTDKSTGGGGFHEFVMEDKANEEYIRMQSERDYTEIIKNNADISIGFEHTSPGDMTHKVYNNRTEEIDQGDYSRTVKSGNEIIDVATDRTMTIGSNETRDVGADFTENIGSNSTIDVGSELTITAGSKITLKVGGSTIEIDSSSITVTTTQLSLSGSGTAELVSDGQCSVGASMVDIAGDAMTTVGGGMVDVAADGIAMVGGSMVMVN